jgi:hypothetical protein
VAFHSAGFATDDRMIGSCSEAGLPDGIFSNHTHIQIWVYFGGPWNGKCSYIRIYDSHLVYVSTYFKAIWYIMWSFGTFIFPRFGKLYQEKSGNPVLRLCGFFLSVALFFSEVKKT